MKRPGQTLKILAIVGVIALMLLTQLGRDFAQYLAAEKITLSDYIWKMGYTAHDSAQISDKASLYGDDADDVRVNPLYVTVLPTQDGKGQPQLFADMNRITTHDVAVPVFDAEVRTQPSGAGAAAAITLRGQSSFLSSEKSYKVKFSGQEDNWLGFHTLFLNKHPFDHSRIRNKVCFDLFEEVAHFNSLRTHFVRLYVQDRTDPAGADYQDYGLYEFIEPTDKPYLKDRGLDENGIIFKANFNEFYRYPDAIMPSTDPKFKLSEFEKYLELKTGSLDAATRKLVRMLDDVNNERLDIDQVFDMHFNRDNYFTYLAMQILLGNFDSEERNYYFYSPHDSLTWYFMPWDFDKSLMADITRDINGQQADFIGIAHYWGVLLHQRMFKKPANVAALNQRIEELYREIWPDTINRLIDKYAPVAEQNSLDDLLRYEKVDRAAFDEEIQKMRTCIELNRAQYYATLGKPMPVYLSDVEPAEEGLAFSWSESYDLQGDSFSYLLQVSKNPAFTDLVFEKNRITANQYHLNLSPGTYYWRVLVKDANGDVQVPFDDLIVDGNHYFGLKRFAVT